MKTYKEKRIRLVSRTISYQFFVMFTLLITGLIVGATSTQIVLMILSGWTIGWAAYFVHEEVWNKIYWERGGNSESKLRSVTKVITWRMVTVITVFLCAILFEMNLTQGLIYTIIFNITIIFVHYVHERIWNEIRWGKTRTARTNQENIVKKWLTKLKNPV